VHGNTLIRFNRVFIPTAPTFSYALLQPLARLSLTLAQVRTTVPSKGGILRVTPSYDSQQNDVGFTLEVFTHAPARWDTTARKLPFDDATVRP
jgi:hypothetical protein